MKKIVLKNFKCFEEQEINFRNLTILAGANGSGKSTVIQSMLLFKQSFTSKYAPNKIYLNGYYFEAGTSKDILYEKAKEDKISFEFFIDEAKSENFLCEVNNEEPRILNIENHSFSNDFFEAVSGKSYNPIFSGYDFISADRLGPKMTYIVSNDDIKGVGKYGEFTVNLLNEYKNVIIQDKKVYLKDKEQNSSLLTEVNEWLSYILDGVIISTQVLDSVNLALLKITNYSSSILDYKSPINMPYGASYILPIIVACLLKKTNEAMQKILYKDRFVFIENPEAHLHPTAQSKLGKFLAKMANSGVQIIIETHSDHIINGIRIAIKNKEISNKDVVFNSFSKGKGLGENYVEEILIDENGRLDKWPKGFFDQYENDMLELL